MDNRAEVREFLISRRAKITPQQAGLPDVGPRRVPGLRRGEVAALAGVSIEYYSKLERGSLAGVSASVLDAIARALQLDDAERAHLFHLAHAADGTSAIMRPRRRTTSMDAAAQPAMGSGCHHHRPGNRPQRPDGPARHQPSRPGDALVPLRQRPRRPRTSPATPSSTTTPTGSTPTGTSPPTPASRSCAPKPAATPTTRHSTTSSANCPPAARSSAAAGAPTTSACTAPAPNSFTTTSSATSTLAYESLDMVAEPGLTMTIYAAEPDSPTADALALLASWAATHAPATVQST